MNRKFLRCYPETPLAVHKNATIVGMKALSLESPKKWKRIEIEPQGTLKSGDARVRVHRVGICGSDVSAYLGKMPLFQYPRIPGHELGVEVLEVAADVTNVAPGDHCSVEPYINDPNSYASRRGRSNCCERLQVLGVHIDGGLRPEFVLPRTSCTFPANSISSNWRWWRLWPSAAMPCAGRRRKPEETCLIIGVGPIGLSVLEFVKLAGSKVMLLDTNADRLDFCRRVMSVPHTLQPSARIEDDLRELTDGHLPDVVIDATGSSKSMSQAFSYVAQGGRLVFVGLTG